MRAEFYVEAAHSDPFTPSLPGELRGETTFATCIALQWQDDGAHAKESV